MHAMSTPEIPVKLIPEASDGSQLETRVMDQLGSFAEMMRDMRAQLIRKYRNGLTSECMYDHLSRSTLYSWIHRKTFKFLSSAQKYLNQATPYNNTTDGGLCSNLEIVKVMKC